MEIRMVEFQNTNKKSEKAPDVTGTWTIDGVEHDYAMWYKFDKNGKKYKSAQVKPKEDGGYQKQQPKQKTPPPTDSDLPW